MKKLGFGSAFFRMIRLDTVLLRTPRSEWIKNIERKILRIVKLSPQIMEPSRGPTTNLDNDTGNFNLGMISTRI